MKITSLSSLIFLLVFAFCDQPACAPAAAGDEHWDYRFGMPGADDGVLVIVTNGSDMYIGGSFRSVAGVAASRVARWDGLRWSALGGGLNSSMVWAIAFQGQNVFVGGAFTAAGGVNATNIARWDGTNWYSLGPGLNGTIYALAAVGTNVYAGGMFTGAGGLAVTNMARWDGTSWSAMNGGLTGSGTTLVKALATDGTNLYAGGGFTNAGGAMVNNFAVWNGTSWSDFGGGLGTNNGILSILADGSNLYLAGSFSVVGGVPANKVVKWNGSGFEALGNGLPESNVILYAMARMKGDLYVGGMFTNAAGLVVNNIARWNGSVWTNVAGGVTAASPPSTVYSLGVGPDGRLYCGGLFDGAGVLGVNCLAAWDGTNWVSVNAGANNGVFLPAVSTVRAVAVDETDLYVGGTFQAAGNLKASRIAHWDGTNWTALNGGMHGTNDSPLFTAVSALAIGGGNVFAGGNFTNAGGITASNIARWDGTNWWPLGSGVNGTVSALAVSGSDVYAGGNFTSAGGGNATNIAHWNGSTWSALGTGLNGSVSAIAIGSDGAYVGGTFTAAGGVTVNRVARWDGVAWNSLGSGTTNGVGGNVNAILPVSPTQIYVGGTFTTAGAAAASRVALFDGSNWLALGSGISGGTSPSVNALVYDGANLYASGVFTNAGGTMVSSIARWDGGSWTGLGSGLARLAVGGTGPIAGTGTSLARNGDDLYAGGLFVAAGGKVSSEIAHWNGQTSFAPPAVMRLGGATVSAGGQFEFRVTASSDVIYVVEASGDLTAWQPVVTNGASPLNVIDANASGNAQRFYRVRQAP